MSMASVSHGLRRRGRHGIEALRLRPLVALGRVALWSAVVLVLGRGLVSFLPEGEPPAPGAAAGVVAAEGSLPTEHAMAFASRFASDYLTLSALDPGAQRERLAPYLAEGVEAGEGYQGSGSESVTQVLPAQAEVRGEDLAVVTVAARLASGRWVHLAVPVSTGPGGALAVVSSPTLVPAPPRASPPRTMPESAEGDTGAGRALTPALRAFFAAYAAGDRTALSYYLAPGAKLSGLEGVVTLQEVSAVWVAPRSTPGAPGTRVARASVRFGTPAGAALTQRYELALAEDAGRFYVSSLGPVLPGPTTPSMQTTTKE